MSNNANNIGNIGNIGSGPNINNNQGQNLLPYLANNTISNQFSIPLGCEPNDISVYSSTIVFVKDTTLNRIIKLTLQTSTGNAVITNTPYSYQDLSPSGLTRDSTRGSVYVSFQDANIIIILNVIVIYLFVLQ